MIKFFRNINGKIYQGDSPETIDCVEVTRAEAELYSAQVSSELIPNDVKRIAELKSKLSMTDFKYVGDYDQVEDTSLTAQRQSWREELRLLEEGMIHGA